MKIEKRYWFCLIGGINPLCLKDGADAPMRRAVREQFRATTGEEDKNCWSGWGIDEKRVDDILIASAAEVPISEQFTKLKTALETIRDAFWSDGETSEERLQDLKRIADEALQFGDQF